MLLAGDLLLGNVVDAIPTTFASEGQTKGIEHLGDGITTMKAMVGITMYYSQRDTLALAVGIHLIGISSMFLLYNHQSPYRHSLNL